MNPIPHPANCGTLGGATALIAAYHRTAGPRYTYILDVFLSITAMTIWAIFVNNLGRRRYPTQCVSSRSFFRTRLF
jgi:hypothetical protein